MGIARNAKEMICPRSMRLREAQPCDPRCALFCEGTDRNGRHVVYCSEWKEMVTMTRIQRLLAVIAKHLGASVEELQAVLDAQPLEPKPEKKANVPG